MAGIFTRNAIGRIMADDSLTPEQRTEQVYSLYGRALDEGYVSKSAAQAAQEAAVEQARDAWEKGLERPDVRKSEEYLALEQAFEDYRTMQQARTSEAFAAVKPKFFETVYGMLDRSEGARSVEAQLEDIRAGFEEYFVPEPEARRPTFGAPLMGGMPRGQSGAVRAFEDAWGFEKAIGNRQ